MSGQFRYRVTAMVLGGLLCAAPLLAAGTANAEQVPDRDWWGAAPADPWFAPPCSIRPMRLEPDCVADAEPLMDTTGPTTASTASTAGPGGTQQAPQTGTSSTGSTAGATSPGADSTRVSSAGTGAVSAPMGVTRPDGTAGKRRPPPSHKPAHSVHHGRGTVVRKAPSAGAGRLSRTTLQRTAARAPFVGVPPAARTGVPRTDLGATASAAPPSSPNGIAVAQRVARVEPLPDSAPPGLLALVAAVCVAGVTTAAIRAIATQRANGAKGV